jgi:hypothetical protein
MQIHLQALISLQDLPIHTGIRLRIPGKLPTKVPSTYTPPITPITPIAPSALPMLPAPPSNLSLQALKLPANLPANIDPEQMLHALAFLATTAPTAPAPAPALLACTPRITSIPPTISTLPPISISHPLTSSFMHKDAVQMTDALITPQVRKKVTKQKAAVATQATTSTTVAERPKHKVAAKDYDEGPKPKHQVSCC